MLGWQYGNLPDLECRPDGPMDVVLPLFAVGVFFIAFLPIMTARIGGLQTSW